MDRIGWIRGEWHSCKDNLPLANLISQTHVFNIDPNYPHSVGMFMAHRVIKILRKAGIFRISDAASAAMRTSAYFSRNASE